MKPGAMLIRADATRAIGIGHVMRCLALAEAWQEVGGTASLASAELPTELCARITAEGMSVTRIQSDPGSPQDVAETVAYARSIEAGWIVVDGDRFGADFLNAVRASGFRLLLIDDFADRESFPADLIVNPNLNDNEERYRKRGASARLALGMPYVLLRREFRQLTANEQVYQSGNKILVTLGGSDPENLTSAVARALAQCPSLDVMLVVGPSYRDMHEIEPLNAHNLQVVQNPPNMAHLMKQSDQAVIAAGGTLWELLSVGCAILSYSRNIVQGDIVRALSHRGIVRDMGETRDFDASKLVASVRELADSNAMRQQMASRGQMLVDGLGTTRVVEAMCDLGAR
jgi:UDP-2,4-diacetamido-2,4,6-trideoxy-beta-L-altropyranose hydrolase